MLVLLGACPLVEAAAPTIYCHYHQPPLHITCRSHVAYPIHLGGRVVAGDEVVMRSLALAVVSALRARDEVVVGSTPTVYNLTTTSSREAQPRSSPPHH